ncbi:MAG TPA: hypothetical protein PKW98_13915 [Candidatus Wallbacteria bacterium]|nr:MAG: hypothetical protein BWY32_00087 [bacterium ADurb.Bin243]HOD42035.1 hypothetical protein [Candidatus Wallbacteria bacterium]HPG58910.1 hypothetical protein [Candidatus Wallbacteria bacterium]
MKLDFNRVFQILVTIVLIYVILILNTLYQGKPSLAQGGSSSYVSQAPEVPTFPVKITNLEQFSPKFVSAFSVNKENQFVVVDNLNRSIVFYEITWNGPTASIQVKANTGF